ncbi:AzlD domain-containing protein [Alphaproteobacteria bacterium]|jgi:uncharacterized membrane protein|nr:AzlD domain-containing protein [Alphaproteobacteria bacterium]
MIDQSTVYFGILGVALITYATRLSGLILMDFFPLTKRVERALEAMTGSVFVAFVVPAFYKGDLGVKMATAAALIVMFTTRKILLALTAGVLVAVAVRAYLGS